MYLASGSAFDSAGRRAAERFLRVLGSPQKYTATTIDTPSKPLVAELVGGWSGLTPVWDHERSTLLVLIGSNPVVSHGHSNAMPDPVSRLRDHRARGGEVWVIDPRTDGDGPPGRPPPRPSAGQRLAACSATWCARCCPSRRTAEDDDAASAGHRAWTSCAPRWSR